MGSPHGRTNSVECTFIQNRFHPTTVSSKKNHIWDNQNSLCEVSPAENRRAIDFGNFDFGQLFFFSSDNSTSAIHRGWAPQRVEPRRVELQGWGAQHFELFFPFPATGPAGLAHDNLKNSKRAHVRAPALQTPPKFHEGPQERDTKKRAKKNGRERKKTQNFGRSGGGRGERTKHSTTAPQHTERVRYTFIQIAKKNSSKNTFIQTLSSKNTFIQKHFRPKPFHPKEKTISSTTLSSKNGFIQ